jgi:hypothetical protein
VYSYPPPVVFSSQTYPPPTYSLPPISPRPSVVYSTPYFNQPYPIPYSTPVYSTLPPTSTSMAYYPPTSPWSSPSTFRPNTVVWNQQPYPSPGWSSFGPAPTTFQQQPFAPQQPQMRDNVVSGPQPTLTTQSTTTYSRRLLFPRLRGGYAQRPTGTYYR